LKRYDLEQVTQAYETMGVMEVCRLGDYVEWKDAEKLVKLIEVYEWLFETGCSVCKDATVREDGQVWVVYDVDGDLITRGRDAEEAAWGAWDRAHRRVGSGRTKPFMSSE